MLRKILAFCQEWRAHPQFATSHSTSLALEFRRQPIAALWQPLKRIVALWGTHQPEASRQENFYRTLARNAPDGIFVVNRALQFVEANDSFCRLWGLSRKEILAQTLPEILAGVDCEPDFFSDLLARTSGRGELTIRTSSNARRILELQTTRLPNDLFMGLARDLTERKLREDELCRTAGWRALLLRALNVGLGIIDGEGRILLCNRAFETALGLSTQHLHDLSLLKPFWQTPQRQCLWSLCNLHGTPLLGVENPFYRAVHLQQRVHDCRLQVEPQGKVLAVDTAPLHDEHNALLGAVVTLRDVSAEFHHEREKEATHLRRQQSACFAAQRTLARELAPQLEDPSSGIALYAQMLMSNLPATSEEAVLVRGILKETNSLLETIRELRSLAQQHGAKKPLRSEAVEPASLAFDDLYKSPSWLQGVQA